MRHRCQDKDEITLTLRQEKHLPSKECWPVTFLISETKNWQKAKWRRKDLLRSLSQKIKPNMLGKAWWWQWLMVVAAGVWVASYNTGILRKQRNGIESKQAIIFKAPFPAPYFFQLGPASRCFYSPPKHLGNTCTNTWVCGWDFTPQPCVQELTLKSIEEKTNWMATPKYQWNTTLKGWTLQQKKQKSGESKSQKTSRQHPFLPPIKTLSQTSNV